MRCSPVIVQRVEAPVSVVWSLVRRFDEPQIYKHFVRKCSIRGEGDLKVKVGCLKEVQVVSGLPAATSRLDILDEEQHILSFSVVGGDHGAEQLSIHYQSARNGHKWKTWNQCRMGITMRRHVYSWTPSLNTIYSPWLTSPST